MITRLLTLIILCSSCVHYQGPDGTTLTMAMTNAQSVSAGGLRMEAVNQTEGVRVAGEAVSNWIRIKAWFGLAEAGVDAVEGIADDVIDAATN